MMINLTNRHSNSIFKLISVEFQFFIRFSLLITLSSFSPPKLLNDIDSHQMQNIADNQILLSSKIELGQRECTQAVTIPAMPTQNMQVQILLSQTERCEIKENRSIRLIESDSISIQNKPIQDKKTQIESDLNTAGVFTDQTDSIISDAIDSISINLVTGKKTLKEIIRDIKELYDNNDILKHLVLFAQEEYKVDSANQQFGDAIYKILQMAKTREERGRVIHTALNARGSAKWLQRAVSVGETGKIELEYIFNSYVLSTLYRLDPDHYWLLVLRKSDLRERFFRTIDTQKVINSIIRFIDRNADKNDFGPKLLFVSMEGYARNAGAAGAEMIKLFNKTRSSENQIQLTDECI